MILVPLLTVALVPIWLHILWEREVNLAVISVECFALLIPQVVTEMKPTTIIASKMGKDPYRQEWIHSQKILSMVWPLFWICVSTLVCRPAVKPELHLISTWLSSLVAFTTGTCSERTRRRMIVLMHMIINSSLLNSQSSHTITAWATVQMGTSENWRMQFKENTDTAEHSIPQFRTFPQWSGQPFLRRVGSWDCLAVALRTLHNLSNSTCASYTQNVLGKSRPSDIHIRVPVQYTRRLNFVNAKDALWTIVFTALAWCSWSGLWIGPLFRLILDRHMCH